MIWLLLDSSSIGGIERHVATLAGALRRAGYEAEVVLLARHGRNPWIEQLAAEGIDFRVLDGGLSGLLKALARQRPALVHTHGYKAGILARVAATSLRIPLVATFHAGERGRFPVNAYQMLDEWTSFAAQRLAVSEKIRHGLPFGAALAPNFLPVAGTWPDRPLPSRVGFVGRLSNEKGPDRFCTLARSRPAGSDWHVWGDGPMRAELEAQFGDVVTFHGVVTDLEPVWSSIGLLVMPSRAEGLPMAALEALSMGIPVLASAVGDLPAVIETGTTGWLVRSGDMEEARRCVATWHALDAARQRIMRRACWQSARDRFSEETHLPVILGAYARAGFKCGQSRPRAA